MTKPCSTCHVVKPLSEFHTRSKSKDGYTGVCKDCRRVRLGKHYRDVSPLKNCQWCGRPLPSNAWKMHKACREASNLAAREAKGRMNKIVPPVLTEMDRILSSLGDSECYRCQHLHTCRQLVKDGFPVICQPEGVSPIPVVGFDVSSEFDGISLTLSVWEEVER